MEMHLFPLILPPSYRRSWGLGWTPPLLSHEPWTNSMAVACKYFRNQIWLNGWHVWDAIRNKSLLTKTIPIGSEATLPAFVDECPWHCDRILITRLKKMDRLFVWKEFMYSKEMNYLVEHMKLRHGPSLLWHPPCLLRHPPCSFWHPPWNSWLQEKKLM